MPEYHSDSMIKQCPPGIVGRRWDKKGGLASDGITPESGQRYKAANFRAMADCPEAPNLMGRQVRRIHSHNEALILAGQGWLGPFRWANGLVCVKARGC